MKKIFLLATVVALAACGGNNPKKADATEIREQMEQQTGTRVQSDGAYTAMRAVTAEDKALFDDALEGLVGVTYTPDSVATQVVDGTNYKFLCQAVTATREPLAYRAEVVIYKSLPRSSQKAMVTSIVRLGEQQAPANAAPAETNAAPAADNAPAKVLGAYSRMRALTAEDKAVFDEAVGAIIGVSYKPDSVATQLVNGTNYRFLCNAEIMTNPRRKFTAEVTVYRPLPNSGGRPIVTSIRQIGA